ncbi:MAG: hypothetical protein JKY54_07130 [Flavobacteriales bacterium]|nr:hypothetical protein [Flavobacteriales bacterium]
MADLPDRHDEEMKVRRERALNLLSSAVADLPTDEVIQFATFISKYGQQGVLLAAHKYVKDTKKSMKASHCGGAG